MADLLSEVARRSRDGGSLTLMKFSLPQSASLTAPPEEEPIITFADSVSLRLGHAPALNVHRTFIHYRVDTSLPYRSAYIEFLLTLGRCFIAPYEKATYSHKAEYYSSFYIK